MNEEIHQSILEVVRAIDNLNRAFAKRSEDLKKLGNANELQQWLKAVHAMQDSGNIYLNWAKHYAHSAGVKMTAEESEESDFLDEGSNWTAERGPGP
jgi:hypothetical protein